MTAVLNRPYRHYIAVIAAVVVVASSYAVSSDLHTMNMIADVVFTAIPDAAYATHVVLSLNPTSSIIDRDRFVLDGAGGITVFELGNHTYVAVTSYGKDGVQILDVTDPTEIIAAGNIKDDNPSYDLLELLSPAEIATFKSGDSTYAAVTAIGDAGVQILNITDPYRITAPSRIDKFGDSSLELSGAWGIAIFNSNNHIYAAVAASS